MNISKGIELHIQNNKHGRGNIKIFPTFLISLLFGSSLFDPSLITTTTSLWRNESPPFEYEFPFDWDIIGQLAPKIGIIILNIIWLGQLND